MEQIDFTKYDMEIKRTDNHDAEADALLVHLQSIILDRSIPEESKIHIKNQYDEIINGMSMMIEPPTIFLMPKAK